MRIDDASGGLSRATPRIYCTVVDLIPFDEDDDDPDMLFENVKDLKEDDSDCFLYTNKSYSLSGLTIDYYMEYNKKYFKRSKSKSLSEYLSYLSSNKRRDSFLRKATEIGIGYRYNKLFRLRRLIRLGEM